jgi:hypothetical protein
VQKPPFQFTLPQALAVMTWLAVALAGAKYISSVTREPFVLSAGIFSFSVVSFCAMVFLYLRIYTPANLKFNGVTAERMRTLSGALLATMLLAAMATIAAVVEPNWLMGVAGMALMVLGVVPFAILAVRGPPAGRVFCATVLVIVVSGTWLLMAAHNLFRQFPWSLADLASFAEDIRYGAVGIWAVAIVSGLMFSLVAWSLQMTPNRRRVKQECQLRSKLAAFVSAGRDLQARRIADETLFQAWKNDVLRWQADCRDWAASGLLPEDVATITSPPPVDSICLDQFNAEHGNLLCKVACFVLPLLWRIRGTVLEIVMIGSIAALLVASRWPFNWNDRRIY